jgi:TonB family protein
MTTLLYQPGKKWRFGVALGAAVIIHFGAIGLAKVRNSERSATPEPSGSTAITFDDPAAPDDPSPNDTELLPAPPTIDATYFEPPSTPPPRTSVHLSTPIPKSRNNRTPLSLNLSSARILALSAPRIEYPYEARRQKITGDGIAILTIDPDSGNVIDVTMAKSTGNSFLDNAALAGFKRWRFKPGTASSVTCPVTFTLTGASY